MAGRSSEGVGRLVFFLFFLPRRISQTSTTCVREALSKRFGDERRIYMKKAFFGGTRNLEGI